MFHKKCSQVAISFMSGVFVQQACDDVEYKHHFRPEGLLGMIIITNIYTLVLSPLSATFETILVNFAPYQKAIEDLTCYLCSTENWIFFDIEKKYPEIQAELKRRRMAA